MSAADRLRALAPAAVLAAGAVIAALLAPSAAVAAEPAPQAAAVARQGFTARFWSPYWFFNRKDMAGDLRAALTAQQSTGADQVVVSWTVHADAGSAAYPAAKSLGLGAFNDATSMLVEADQELGLTTWMGLVVAPDSWADASKFTSEAFLEQQEQLTLKVADDLWARYGDAIDGWYIPVEPSLDMISTPQRAARLGQWYEAIAEHLHAISGKPVMVSPSMPYAANAGISATAFVQDMRPMVAAAKSVDVWNLQDGFEMTAWTPTQEADAFRAAKAVVATTGAELWASVYTPASDGNGTVPFSKLRPYLEALGATGVPLSQWLFSDYLAPADSHPTDSRTVANLADYRAWLAAGATKVSPASAGGSTPLSTAAPATASAATSAAATPATAAASPAAASAAAPATSSSATAAPASSSVVPATTSTASSTTSSAIAPILRALLGGAILRTPTGR